MRDNVKMDENLVFLLSMPRSGSTLLSMMLGSHPAICCPPEPWIVLALADCLDLGQVRKMIYGREWAGIAAIEFLLNAERKKRNILGKVVRAIGEASQFDSAAAARHILESAYQAHLDVSGKSIFVDKTPRYYIVLELIDDLFPQAKKILLLRNPLDIYASYRKTWGTSRSIFAVEGVSDHTRDFCEGLFTLARYKDAAKNDVYVVRYEDLLINTEIELRSVCKFANIDFSPAMMSYDDNKELMEDYRRSPVGDQDVFKQSGTINLRKSNTWEQQLDHDDLQDFINVTGIDILECLGYSDTVAKLKSMPLKIPTERQALENRNKLMIALAENVPEQPFRAWLHFVSSLKLSPPDVDRDVEALKQKLNLANAQLEQLRSGNSWKMTRPLRCIRRSLSLGNSWFSVKNAMFDKVRRSFRKNKK